MHADGEDHDQHDIRLYNRVDADQHSARDELAVRLLNS